LLFLSIGVTIDCMAKTSTIMLTCADYRGEEAHHHLVEVLGSADRLVALGASLGIVDERRRLVVFDEIKDLCALHGCTTLLIVDHMNCGKYRVKYGIGSNGQPVLEADRERQLHQGNLATAKRVVEAHFPELEVTTLLLEHDSATDNLMMPAPTREPVRA
jgi:hypothetical protein